VHKVNTSVGVSVGNGNRGYSLWHWKHQLGSVTYGH